MGTIAHGNTVVPSKASVSVAVNYHCHPYQNPVLYSMYVEPIPPPPVPGPAHAYVQPVEGGWGPSFVAIREGRLL